MYIRKEKTIFFFWKEFLMKVFVKNVPLRGFRNSRIFLNVPYEFKSKSSNF